MKNTLRRLFCLLLCTVMLAGVLPGAAYAATRLGAPSEITWSPVMPGSIYWTVNEPVEQPETYYRVNLYKDGVRVHSQMAWGYTGDIDDYDVRYFECRFDDEYDLTSGDYHVTIRAIAQQEGYTDSKAVKSGTWSYTHPGVSYPRPTDLTWNYPIVSWKSNSGYAANHVKVYYSATKDGTPEEIYFSDLVDADTLDISEYIRYAGKGYYSFKVRTESMDITQKYHSKWSEMSEPYYSNGRYLATPTLKVSTDSETGFPKLVWNKVANAQKYRLYRANSKSGTYSVVKTTKLSSSFLDTTAEPGKTYYYKVRALGEDPFEGETCYSAYSNIVSDLCVLGKPSITVSLNDDGDPLIRWETVEGAAKYYIYRSTSRSSGFKHVQSAISARSFTDTTAASGTRYYYKVKAIHRNTDANSAYSSVKSVTAK